MKLNLIGNVLGNSGYAIHTRNLLFALDKVCDVGLETQRFQDWETSLFSEFIKKDYSKENTLMISFPDWWRIKYTENLPFLGGYGIFEGDKVPLNWARNCKDKRLDILFTPSEHTKTAFINSGVPKDKIEVIRHGVNCDVFKPKGKKLWNDGIFRFLFVGGWKDGVRDRKGLDIALRAFKEEFGAMDGDKVKFIGKINMAYGGRIKENLEALNLPEGLPNIDIITDDLNEEQLATLYRSCDVFVMPTRAEAFCLPVAESLACGCPIIATDYGGHTEFAKEFGMLVKAKWIPATGGPFYEGVRWKQIDYIELKASLRFMFENQKITKKMGKLGSKYIKKNLTWKHTATKIINSIKTHR